MPADYDLTSQGFRRPVLGYENTWGTHLNYDIDLLDTVVDDFETRIAAIEALTAGTRLTSLEASRTADEAILTRLRAAVATNYRPGIWYTTLWGGDSSQTPLNETMYAVEFPIFQDDFTGLDRIGLEVTSAGQAGSKIRLGLYADKVDGWGMYPGALVFEGIQKYGASAYINGVTVSKQEITIDEELTAGRYWLTLCVQGAPTTQPTIKMTSGYRPGLGGLYSDIDNLFRGGFKENTPATTGNFPSIFPTTENATRGSKIYFRTKAS